jgi:hypothetical protein
MASHPIPADLASITQALLTDLTGAATLAGDPADPVTIMVRELVGEFARHQHDARTHAAGLIRDLENVLNGRIPSTLASSSGSRNYDAAIAAMDALRSPLAAAVALYCRAHPTTP